ncbi:MAG: methyltransferase domain-containing protein [Pseudomonadota bacterium]
MDLFGEALRDRHAGHLGRVLTIRRDDDHTDQHDPGVYFTDTPFAHEIDLLAQARGPVLDVGCGAGRTLLWLERNGLDATGIDLSRGAVEVARSRGCQDVRHGDVMADGAQPLDGARFQTVILFGNNMGIGGTLEGAAALLRRISRVVRPGGQLFVTGLDIALTDTPSHLAYHRANQARGRPRGEITMRFEYQGKLGTWVPWFHPEPHELERLAHKTGWDVERLEHASGPFFAATLRAPEERTNAQKPPAR